MTKQEAIKAFVEGREIFVTVNGDKDSELHLTMVGARLERRAYERMFGRVNEKDFRRMYITDYIDCLVEDCMDVYGKANVEYRQA